MRISDWSSDVCSSDVVGAAEYNKTRAGIAMQDRGERSVHLGMNLEQALRAEIEGGVFRQAECGARLERIRHRWTTIAGLNPIEPDQPFRVMTLRILRFGEVVADEVVGRRDRQ